MTGISRSREDNTFGRHVHWRSCHAVKICSSHCNACPRLALFRKYFRGSKIRELDVSNSVEENVYVNNINEGTLLSGFTSRCTTPLLCRYERPCNISQAYTCITVSSAIRPCSSKFAKLP